MPIHFMKKEFFFWYERGLEIFLCINSLPNGFYTKPWQSINRCLIGALRIVWKNIETILCGCVWVCVIWFEKKIWICFSFGNLIFFTKKFCWCYLAMSFFYFIYESKWSRSIWSFRVFFFKIFFCQILAFATQIFSLVQIVIPGSCFFLDFTNGFLKSDRIYFFFQFVNFIRVARPKRKKTKKNNSG